MTAPATTRRINSVLASAHTPAQVGPDWDPAPGRSWEHVLHTGYKTRQVSTIEVEVVHLTADAADEPLPSDAYAATLEAAGYTTQTTWDDRVRVWSKTAD
ncbi:hypothetical protein [Nocardiopsis protaetiae]|uniref:hypothetical protein n=1 Tax=Nocardiopsis protaetiae TaxID=3382270 RepID=UPI00387B7E18